MDLEGYDLVVQWYPLAFVLRSRLPAKTQGTLIGIGLLGKPGRATVMSKDGRATFHDILAPTIFFIWGPRPLGLPDRLTIALMSQGVCEGLVSVV